MKNKLSDLRNHLFATLEALRDEEKPMEIARAHAVAEISREIIHSAKVELQAMEVLGEVADAPFFDSGAQGLARPEQRRLGRS